MEEREKLYRYKIKINHLSIQASEIQHCLAVSRMVDYASIKTKGIVGNITICKTIKCTQSELKVLLSDIVKIGYTTSIAKIKRLWF